jgi:hypothetical protein
MERLVSDYKGIGIVFVRTLVRSKGPSAEATVLSALAPPDRDIYERTIATDWVAIEVATQVFQCAAPLLYAYQPNAIRRLGRELAHNNLRGAYKFIARVLTIPFLLGQAATFWQTYHRHGKGRIDRREEKGVDFVVEGYPRLPERFRECMCGWIVGAVELTGNDSVVVSKSDDAPSAWRWQVRWR